MIKKALFQLAVFLEQHDECKREETCILILYLRSSLFFYSWLFIKSIIASVALGRYEKSLFKDNSIPQLFDVMFEMISKSCARTCVVVAARKILDLDKKEKYSILDNDLSLNRNHEFYTSLNFWLPMIND